MLRFLFALLFLLPSAVVAQAPAPAVEADLARAMSGSWIGTLEYRDYSEPATSLKRVQLPTWLSISPAGANLALHFIYDDGPTKTVEENEVLTFSAKAGTYVSVDNGKPAQTFAVTGFDKLQAGRGELILLGTSTDNNQPAESRITLTVRRNLLSWLEESRPANSTAPFAFRHRYTFTRATPPAITQ